MEEEKKKKKCFGVTFTGDVTFNGPMFDIHDNEHVHIHNSRIHQETDDEDEEQWEAVELKFFDMKRYGSDEKQQRLRRLLRYATTKIDVNNGREWFCIYAADRYAEGCTGVKMGYVEFFTDIETLLPNVLKRINAMETGNKRYKPYSELLRREVENWYVFNGCLPPINELVYQMSFGCSREQFKKCSVIIKDLYRQMREI